MTITQVFRNAGVAALLGIAGIVCAARSDCGSAASRWPASPPALVIDSLDVFSAELPGLKLTNAWKVGGLQNLAIYTWVDGSPGSVTVTCSTPIEDNTPCDRSTPVRLNLGKTSACGFKTYDEYNGPAIFWTSCSMQASKPRVKDVWRKLQIAATTAAWWSERYRSAAAGGDRSSFQNNRDVGLLAATRAGHPEIPGLRGQLD